MVWNLNVPPIIFYNAVEELVALSKAGNVPKEKAQNVNIGVEIIMKTQDFETVLSEWFKNPAVEHTWQVFKYHFIDSHTALKRICERNICNTLYHQANHMAAELNTNV